MIDAVRQRVGGRAVVTDPGEIAPWLTDWRGRWHGRSLALLQPASTADVAAIVELSVQHRVPLVPQGGNTSMVGGATPDGSGAQIPVSLARLNRVRDVDPVDMTMTAEAGVVVKAAQDAAAAAGCLFPLSFGGEGSATVGGRDPGVPGTTSALPARSSANCSALSTSFSAADRAADLESDFLSGIGTPSG